MKTAAGVITTMTMTMPVPGRDIDAVSIILSILFVEKDLQPFENSFVGSQSEPPRSFSNR